MSDTYIDLKPWVLKGIEHEIQRLTTLREELVGSRNLPAMRVAGAAKITQSRRNGHQTPKGTRAPLSEAGRAAISRAMTARWKRYRMEQRAAKAKHATA